MAGAFLLMVEPAPMVAFLPTTTGAISCEPEPTNAPSSILVWCLYVAIILNIKINSEAEMRLFARDLAQNSTPSLLSRLTALYSSACSANFWMVCCSSALLIFASVCSILSREGAQRC